MRILVAGGTGFIGSHLVPALVAAGHEVAVLVRPGGEGRVAAGAAAVTVDLGNLSADGLPEADVLIHLAQANLGFPEHASELLGVNCGSAVAMAVHGVRCGARRLIYASSGSVYGFAREVITETHALAGTGYYAQTKLAAEALLGEFRGRLAVDLLRIFSPYGLGQQGFRLIPDIVSRVREGRPVLVRANGMPGLSPVLVGDVVRVVLARLGAEGSETFNVCGPEATGIREIAEVAGRLLGREPVFGEHEVPLEGGIAASCAKMTALTGVVPVSVEDGLAAVCGGN